MVYINKAMRNMAHHWASSVRPCMAPNPGTNVGVIAVSRMIENCDEAKFYHHT